MDQGITKSEIGFMLECFGVAEHNDLLQNEKAKLDSACKRYLRALFENSPRDSWAIMSQSGVGSRPRILV